MSSLIGILVDVSGSMRNSVGDEVNAEPGSRPRSDFKVADELVKHDVDSSNQTFALALGCPSEAQVFDLLGTVRAATDEPRRIKDLRSRKRRLVDVSGSMRNSVGGEANTERVSWARSIFKVVDELVKHDVESSNQTFALALGCPFEPQVFDLLGTARAATDELRHIKDLRSRKQPREMIDEALDILERNGARRVRTWGKMDVLLKVLDDDTDTAAAILYYLTRRPDFTRRFVSECLPRECREQGDLVTEFGFWAMGLVPEVGERLQGGASESSVREAIDKGKLLLTEIRRDDGGCQQSGNYERSKCVQNTSYQCW